MLIIIDVDVTTNKSKEQDDSAGLIVNDVCITDFNRR